MITLTTLGPLEIRDEQRGSLASLLAQPRRAALFVYLAVEAGGGFVSRDDLLGMFWPESDEGRGRAALRQALVFLRRSLGDGVIVSRGDDSVGVNLEGVACDVAGFRRALSEGRVGDALALYRGDFLTGMLVDDAPAFERWTAGVREALAREAQHAAAIGADVAAKRRDWPAAIALARRAQQHAPLSEDCHRRVITYLDQAGDRASALREHDRFAALLATELEVAPSPETTALVASLRERTVPGESPAFGELPAATPLHPGARVAGVAPVPRRAGVRRIAVAGTLVAAGAAAVLVVLALRDRAQAAPPPGLPRIVVVPFTDETRDTALASSGTMIADWITEGVSRIPDIEVVPIRAVLTSEHALAGERVSGATPRWRHLATDVGASIVVYGAIHGSSGMIHLQAEIAETRSGRLLRPVERVSVPAESVMAGIDRLRTRVVAAIAPLADTVTHLRHAVTPPSHDAYRAYVAGLETFVTGNPQRALSLFERSASADSSYPMPRIAATIMHLNLGNADEAVRLITPLLAERDRLAPLEQSTLDMTQALLQGDLPAAYDAAVRQARIAPGTIGEYMVAEAARRMNLPAEAVAVLRALGPDRGELRGWRPYWRELTFALHLLGEHDAEYTAAREAQARYPSDVTMAGYAARAAAAGGDRQAMDAAVAAGESSSASPELRATLRLTAVTEWVAHGHDGAPELLAGLLHWFESLPDGAMASPSLRRQFARALLLAEHPDSARRVIEPLLQVPNVALATFGIAGNAAAAAGDAAEARRYLAAVAVSARALTPAARGLSWGAPEYWQATIAARLGDSTTAAAALRDARRAGLAVDPNVHAEPAFAMLRHWPPFAALIAPVALPPAAR